jgi:hypothetical protein
LLIALAAFAYAAVPFVDGMMQRWFVRDLDERSALIAYTVEEPLRQLLAESTPQRITAFFNRLTQDSSTPSPIVHRVRRSRLRRNGSHRISIAIPSMRIPAAIGRRRRTMAACI